MSHYGIMLHNYKFLISNNITCDESCRRVCVCRYVTNCSKIGKTRASGYVGTDKINMRVSFTCTIVCVPICMYVICTLRRRSKSILLLCSMSYNVYRDGKYINRPRVKPLNITQAWASMSYILVYSK